MFLDIDGSKIWESESAKLLGIDINNTLKFDEHLAGICLKAGQKITAMRRISMYMSFDKKESYLRLL